ncbi:membrane RL1 protein3 [Human betaherpesvirus 5]|uniref:Membrane RL1 protein3 n=1 Tax=Human cytomegalovirus TaxID=10359 RepID=J7EHD9_HCMV|nr:membrane protein RL13 [Human betaherpesvirus 5]AHJ84924.1 membrane protein RL13 [Human betaherpesvirus 5]AKI09068.1 membrane RL1 protein3 [Human betaherpesvirus 5]APU92204.1 membrane protein RL13 [Human betaherpesvirus 5]QZX46706.1 membrane protein RL13 [Human betaherpesvirus 5]
MDWRVTVTWTILMSTLSESCNQTCPCLCSCNTTASYSTNSTETTTSTFSTTIISNRSTLESLNCSTANVPTTTNVSTKSSAITTQIPTTTNTKVQTTPCTNITRTVTCDGLNYTVHKRCDRSYEVINVTGHVGGNITLKKCNQTEKWHNVEWIHYEHPTHKMCELGNYHQTTPRRDICFDCNDTSLTIYNLTTENAGKYTRRCRNNGQEENYYVTVLTGDTTSSILGTCPMRYEDESRNTENTIGSSIIETIQKANIPLGIHAVWAGVVVSVALIALYMGSHRIPKKPHYTKLPKYDPDEFWTKA